MPWSAVPAAQDEDAESEGAGWFKEAEEGESDMRKIFALLLAAMFAIAAAGCGAGDQDKSKVGSAEPGSGNRKITMGYSQIGAQSTWRAAHTASIKQAAEDAGIELQFSNAELKQENQIRAIRSFIAQKVDIIAFSPIVATGWDEVLKEAKAAKIPVIIVDRDLQTNDDSLYVMRIGTDSVREGREAFRWLDGYMQEKGKKPRDGGAKFNIAEIKGPTGSSVVERRDMGFRDEMTASPNKDRYEIIVAQNSTFQKDGGKQVMTEMLKTYKDKIDILFAQNDDMALGAIEAIEAAGLKPGQDIVIVSCDGTRAIFQAMIDGKSNCTVEGNPLQGPLLMEMAKKVLAGEMVERTVFVKDSVYPAEIAPMAIQERKY